jgi:hypothetical protein
MSRRPKRKPCARVSWEWTPDVAALFLALPAGWTPPARVSVCPGKAHVTLLARFRTAEGHINTGKVRLERCCVTGDLEVVSSAISMSLRIEGGAR